MCEVCICMVKKTTTLTIDSDLIDEAKKELINISAVAEDAIRAKLGKENVDINKNIDHCEFCSTVGIPETRETINQERTGLTWLYPDERWICNECLSVKGRRIIPK